MSYQITKVDLIPNGEIFKCNASQFDNGRVLPFEIYENKVAYNIPNDVRVELHCRKPDGNIITLPSDTITDNIVTFITTTQLTACYGDNVCEIALYGADDYLIGSANFILEVEKSPTYGGINSTSDIHNLETQVEEITTEIVGENYYNKTEVDNLLDDKADVDNVYTKSQTDTLLVGKADVSDLPDMTDYYTKTATDSLLDEKANADDVYTKTEIDNKILDIMPVDTASGSIATFNTELATPLVNVSSNIVATGGNGTPDNPNPINGYSSANITRCGVNLFDDNKLVIASYPYSSMTFDKATYLKAGTYTASISNVVNATSWRFGYRFFNADGTIITNAITNGLVTLTSAMTFSDTYDSNQTCLMEADTNTTTVVINLTQDAYIVGCISNGNIGASTTLDYQIETGNTASTYEAYNGSTVTIAFGQTVYGGVLDVTRGKLKPCIEYPSYNGETLSGRWLSSEATYVEGTTPPTGSQVVSLDDYGSDIDLTPVQIRAIVGTNNVYSDTNGDTTVQYKDSIQHYIDTHTGG